MTASPADYAHIIDDLVDKTQRREQALPLMSEDSGSLFYLQPLPTTKVMLFFHGFTSLPKQFETIGQAFARKGYNVIIPLLPGHGQAGEWSGSNPPPLPTRSQVYKDFGLEWLEIAQNLGQQVVVGGLSGGGTLAAWLAQQQPQQIYRALLFAPYLSSSNRIVDWLTQAIDFYFKWELPPNTPLIGYPGFRTEALRVFLDIGQEVLDHAEHLSAPMFVISSDSDRAVDNDDHDALFNKSLQLQPKCWRQRFDRVLGIPHTMLRAEEGNNYTNLLITLVKAYVESDLTWQQIKEIAYEMAFGQTFYDVVNKLQLADRVSPDMPAMMTMVDKREIVAEYNS